MENYNDEGPIYRQIKERLKKQILAAESFPEDKLPPLRHLKDDFGVSLLTVKRAVDELAKEQWVQPIRKKGIIINREKIDDLKFVSSNINIIVVFQELFNVNNTALQEIIKGIGEAADRKGFTWEMFNIRHNGRKLSDAAMFLKSCDIEKKKCGVILATRMQIRDVLFLLDEKIPFVWINDYLPHEPVHSVMTDKGKIYSLLLSHIKEHKYSKVGIINVSGDPAEASLFREFCRAMNIIPGPVIFEGKTISEFEEKARGEYHALQLLKKKNLPEAIVCVGELTTIGVMEVFRNKGIRIPEDIGLISVVGSREAALHFSMPVSTVVIPFREMAKESLRILLSLLENGSEVPERKFVSPYFVQGTSCGCRLNANRS